MEELTNFVTTITNSYNSDLGKLNKCIVGGIAGYIAYKSIRAIIVLTLKTFAKNPQQIADDPKLSKYDPKKVYVFLFPRSIRSDLPNLSPFVLKLETWLRMAGIDYEAIETQKLSRSTKQIPYIFHKGKEIADSDFIIEYLQNEFKICENTKFSKEELAISRAVSKMVDESTFGSDITYRVYDWQNFNKLLKLPVPSILKDYILNTIRTTLKKRMDARGIGRKTITDVVRIGKDDIRAISLYLDKKKFLLGDEMSQVDCTVFAHLSSMVLSAYDNPYYQFVREDVPNILPYMKRMKEKCWPDWDSIHTAK